MDAGWGGHELGEGSLLLMHTYVCADIYIKGYIYISFKLDEEAGGEAKQLLSNWAPSQLGDVGM